MTLAYWFEQKEQGGLRVQRAAIGSCDLSVLHVGGEWQWLVRQAGRDVAEGAPRARPSLFGVDIDTVQIKSLHPPIVNAPVFPETP